MKNSYLRHKLAKYPEIATILNSPPLLHTLLKSSEELDLGFIPPTFEDWMQFN